MIPVHWRFFFVHNILVIREAQTELNHLIENGNTKGEILVAGLRERQINTVTSMAVLGIAGRIISAGFGFCIARGITQPVRELEQAARGLSEGNFSVIRITYRSKDELGNLADDMRSMADKSASASKSTAALIESSLQTIQDGKKIANKTAVSLTEVVRGVEGVTDSLNDIAEASTDQSDAILRLSESVNIISGVVQTNSATAQESAAASEELSSQAQFLRGLVDYFKLEEGA